MKKAAVLTKLRNDTALQARFRGLDFVPGSKKQTEPGAITYGKVAIPAHDFKRSRRVSTASYTSSPQLLAVLRRMYTGWEKTFQRAVVGSDEDDVLGHSLRKGFTSTRELKEIRAPRGSLLSVRLAFVNNEVVVELSAQRVTAVLLQPLDAIAFAVQEIDRLDCDIMGLLSLERKPLLDFGIDTDKESDEQQRAARRAVVAECLDALQVAKVEAWLNGSFLELTGGTIEGLVTEWWKASYKLSKSLTLLEHAASLLRLFECALRDRFPDPTEGSTVSVVPSESDAQKILESVLVKAVIWSIGACIDTKSRRIFDRYLRDFFPAEPAVAIAAAASEEPADHTGVPASPSLLYFKVFVD
ncbi:Dynein heavy chain AAA lid domain [Phytophthora infestans]|uniref:Dynein heavy chain AAA lid domain n=1 Tax=Phytophthora infestans TaxID=4787 RepID=A0A8S9VCA1_PHYIN|nr:Dynein heavy chain AAA lid domain [Phytophthora infestans]